MTCRPGRSLNKRRTVTIVGRITSIAIEDAFWSSLKEIAVAENISLNQLTARINADRQHANFSSAVRFYVLDYYRRLVELVLGAKGEQ